MTLIMTAITRQNIVMVADMRLTDYRTGKVRDDAACKMVAYRGRFVFAFTGPACLERERTSEWIAKRLSEAPDSETLLQHLIARAERAVQGYPYLQQALAIVGAGWQGGPPNPEPSYFAVTNFDLKSGARQSGFEAVGALLKHNEKARVFAAGARPAHSRLQETEGFVRRRADRSHERAGEFVAALVRAVREESRVNPTVGPDVLIASIPGVHHGVGPPLFHESVMMSVGYPDWRVPEYRFVPSKPGHLIWWMPHVAGQGWYGLDAQSRLPGAPPFVPVRNPCA